MKKVLHIVKVGSNILHTVQTRKCNSIGHILSRNCLLKHVTEGKRQGKIRSDGKIRKKT
jgi:hypothetical protein